MRRSFLDRIASIADREYVPSDVDVLRARIRTLGVQEYNLVFEVRGLTFSPDIVL